MLRNELGDNPLPASPAAESRADSSSSARDLLRRMSEVARGQSFREIASRVGLNPETVRRVLQGGSRPSGEFLSAFCRSYNISAHWLLFGAGPKFGDEVEGTRPRTFMRVAAELRARADEIALMITELELQLARDRAAMTSDLSVYGRASAESFELGLPQGRHRLGPGRTSA